MGSETGDNFEEGNYCVLKSLFNIAIGCHQTLNCGLFRHFTCHIRVARISMPLTWTLKLLGQGTATGLLREHFPFSPPPHLSSTLSRQSDPSSNTHRFWSIKPWALVRGRPWFEVGLSVTGSMIEWLEHSPRAQIDLTSKPGRIISKTLKSIKLVPISYVALHYENSDWSTPGQCAVTWWVVITFYSLWHHGGANCRNSRDAKITYDVEKWR